MAAPVREKQQSNATTTAAFVVGNFLRGKRFEQVRKIACVCFFVGACAVWLAGLGQLGVSHEGLPWYILILCLSVFSVRFLRVDEALISLIGVPRSREPLQLQESLSLCFLAMAIALYSWIGYSLLHPYHEVKLRQVVDIQLLAEKDFENNHEQLPGTELKDDLRKRVADQVSQMGSLTKTKLFQPSEQSKKKDLTARQPEVKPANSNGKTKVEREDEKPSNRAKAPEQAEHRFEPQSSASPLMIPNGWKTKDVDSQFLPVARKPASPSHQLTQNQPYISEVEPPEMVELVENEGAADALHVFQKGGKTSDGKGADNGLSAYLKELHKKIKNAWVPPSGTTHRVQLLFRLKKDGHLAFVRVSKTSGEIETDNSAIKAIVAAANNPEPLPLDYSPNYLDISYSFKYNVDELQEEKTGF